MAGLTSILVVAALAACAALPTPDPVLLRPSDQRLQHAQGSDGQLRLAGLWLKSSDVSDAARYIPDRQNVYHLFTRQNPTVSQPLLLGSESLLELTHFSPTRRTVILLHGWLDNALAIFNRVLVPSFLSAEDLNVIVVDWSVGANVVNYAAAVHNTVASGESVARFVSWLNLATGADSRGYHVVGHNLGAHQAGVVGRNVDGGVAYITALDPALPGWVTNSERLRPDDAQYTEVIHTNAGLLGYAMPLGHTDFYPNGGVSMPGCNSQQCDHERSIHYFAESLASGVFVGRRCGSYLNAMTDNCLLPGRLAMGGLVAKTGSSGIYVLNTNAEPPFAQI